MSANSRLPRVYELDRARHAWPRWGDWANVLVHGLSTWRASDVEPVAIERTGPYVPPITLPGPVDVVVDDATRARLAELVPELRFREVKKQRIVRVDWHTWSPRALEPRFLPPSLDPAGYVRDAPHDEALALAIGPLFEVVADLDLDVEDDDGELCPESYYGQPLVRRTLDRGRNFVSEEMRDALVAVVAGHVSFRPARAVRRAKKSRGAR